MSAQTDSGIRISAFLIYALPEVIVPISGVHSLRLSGISTVSQERV